MKNNKQNRFVNYLHQGFPKFVKWPPWVFYIGKYKGTVNVTGRGRRGMRL